MIVCLFSSNTCNFYKLQAKIHRMIWKNCNTLVIIFIVIVTMMMMMVMKMMVMKMMVMMMVMLYPA